MRRLRTDPGLVLQNKENLRERERARTDDVGRVHPVKIA